MELFFAENIDDNLFELPETEAHHLVHVLRYTIGSELKITDGKGKLANCKINSISKKKCVVEIVSTEFFKNPQTPISIAIAPTKNRERLEWFLEKATEIGVSEIRFIQTQHAEKWNLNIERINKVLVAAIKQSNQFWLPAIQPVVTFEKMLQLPNFEQKFICHNLSSATEQLINCAKPNLKTLIAIGPEGGFSETEISSALNNNFKPVLLGNNRLRTETAGMVAVATLQQINLIN